MKFIDEIVISVQAGDGGNGCCSFRREKYVPKGGPDGGDGGRGGSVVFRATSRENTLYGLRFRRHYKAKRGAHGKGKNQTGRNGEDLIIDVPLGTVISDAQTGERLRDLALDGESFVVLRGGRGGYGNRHFATSTNRAPRRSDPGESGQSLVVKLELKVLADVGIIGLPNVGKSTLVSRLSAARPKVADYPFTTLTPCLGTVELPEREPFVVAEIPGLIEGASLGAGLGTRFLKHVERTRVLLHVIDLSTAPSDDPLEPYRVINHELESFGAGLSGKPQVIALNKIDVSGAAVSAGLMRTALEALDQDVWVISALSGEGLEPLKARLADLVERARKEERERRESEALSVGGQIGRLVEGNR